jgi:hypothetical protein
MDLWLQCLNPDGTVERSVFCIREGKAGAMGGALIGVAGLRRVPKPEQWEARRPHDLRLYQMQDHLDRW